jgi:hypothetical protein
MSSWRVGELLADNCSCCCVALCVCAYIHAEPAELYFDAEQADEPASAAAAAAAADSAASADSTELVKQLVAASAIGPAAAVVERRKHLNRTLESAAFLLAMRSGQ